MRKITEHGVVPCCPSSYMVRGDREWHTHPRGMELAREMARLITLQRRHHYEESFGGDVRHWFDLTEDEFRYWWRRTHRYFRRTAEAKRLLDDNPPPRMVWATTAANPFDEQGARR